jgi:hypothetical protein
VAASGECGNESPDSGVTELVSYYFSLTSAVWHLPLTAQVN